MKELNSVAMIGLKGLALMVALGMLGGYVYYQHRGYNPVETIDLGGQVVISAENVMESPVAPISMAGGSKSGLVQLDPIMTSSKSGVIQAAPEEIGGFVVAEPIDRPPLMMSSKVGIVDGEIPRATGPEEVGGRVFLRANTEAAVIEWDEFSISDSETTVFQQSPMMASTKRVTVQLVKPESTEAGKEVLLAENTANEKEKPKKAGLLQRIFGPRRKSKESATEPAFPTTPESPNLFPGTKSAPLLPDPKPAKKPLLMPSTKSRGFDARQPQSEKTKSKPAMFSSSKKLDGLLVPVEKKTKAPALIPSTKSPGSLRNFVQPKEAPNAKAPAKK